MTTSSATGQPFRRLVIPRVGRLFLWVILLILLPAYWLSISLMFLMAAMFAGIFLYNGLLIYLNLRGLHIELETMPDLFAGRQAQLVIALSNRKRLFPTRYLNFFFDLVGVETNNTRQLVKIPAGDTSRVPLVFTPERRGWLRLNGCYCQTAYPFGLVSLRLVIPMRERFLVFPHILDQSSQRLRAEHLEKGLIPRNSNDYQYLGSYRPGDDVRLIHWRKSALLEVPVMKKDLVHAEVVEPRLFVPDPCPHFEYAISVLATYFLCTANPSGWSVLTSNGIRAVESREDMLAILALILPLGSDTLDSLEEMERFEAIHASQLPPEV